MGLRKTIFGRLKYNPNTFIGGVSSILNTPALVASKLGISASRIKSFSISGDNIQFAVTGGTYASMSNWQSNTNITYFHDLNGLVSALPNYCFRYCSNMVEAKFKNLKIVPANCFDGTALSGTGNDFSSVIQVGNATANGAFYNIASSMPTIINLPNLATCFETAAQANFGGHAILSNNLTFNVPLSLMTSNAGKPNASLTLAALKAVNINYIGYIDNTSFNTEIGNYTGGFINKGQLANFLGFGSGGLVNYYIDGSHTKFKALTNYSISSSRFNSNSSITHYYDLDGFVSSVGSNAFYMATNFKNLKVKNAHTLNSYCLRSTGFIGDNSDFSSVTTAGLEVFTACAAVTNINFPSMTNLGGSVVNNGVFNSIKTGTIITVPIALQTANGGTPDGDLVYASGTRAAVILYI
ncbi:leucine-rich repeat protein [Flavobacterium sp. KACC 22763]|uniref:leucine-rich repeat protein n=1 Tax=Flavobacterium sp. KACC 22763 TaxID=3025668 RepID=UPI0023658754|nr:leucine-rich repeat protein [Flavobacterium sp. KACC 22763]WDF64512.1 leucine-rich repeat protein [Flavobacterium sp. KACC 22763]